MKSWCLTLLLLVLLNPLSIMALSPFAGNWDLSELVDSESQGKDLPQQQFVVRIEEMKEGQLRMVVKIGNNLRTKITLEGGDSPESQQVSVGGVLSTMMLPDPELFEVEKFLSKTLPTVTSMEIVNDQLVFQGKGKIVCSK